MPLSQSNNLEKAAEDLDESVVPLAVGADLGDAAAGQRVAERVQAAAVLVVGATFQRKVSKITFAFNSASFQFLLSGTNGRETQACSFFASKITACLARCLI